MPYLLRSFYYYVWDVSEFLTLKEFQSLKYINNTSKEHEDLNKIMEPTENQGIHETRGAARIYAAQGYREKLI